MQAIKKSYSVFEALETVLLNKLNTAIYRLPDEKDVMLIVQEDHEFINTDITRLHTDRGFLITPFLEDNGNKTYFIKPDRFYKNSLKSEEFDSLKALRGSFNIQETTNNQQRDTDKSSFLDQVTRTISEIKTGKYDKIVLSRIKTVSGKFLPHLTKIFRLLCESYPGAFVYLFRIKDHCWVGASPEPLICSKENKLLTVSLAGTRPYSEENLDVANWNQKEKEEQEYVTQYIEQILAEYGIKRYSKNGPFTKRAGRILHLRTDFLFDKELAGKNLFPLIKALHPTSAVCGIPMGGSLNFIKDSELHDRQYYAGFLGPVGINNNVQLFVNLRCMKVLENQLVLFVGGGITSKSVPEDEWEETEIKAETLLSVVQQV